MDVLWGIAGIVIFFVIISKIGKGIGMVSSRKQYDKAIDASTGLEKIRLICRRGGIGLSLKFPKNGNDDSKFFLIVPSIQMSFADAYYGMLKDMYKRIGRDDPFKEQAESNEFLDDISARLFGVAFGIALEKVATITGKKVKKTAVKEYIKGFTDTDESVKKEITSMAISYIDFMNDEMFGARTDAGWTSKDLGNIAYSLIGVKLKKRRLCS